MMTEIELDEYLAPYPVETQEYIRHVRNSDPSRLTGVGATHSVNGQTWLQSMEHSDQTESQLERDLYTKWDYDYSIYEIWAQLPAEDIHIYDKNNRRMLVTIQTDTLLLTKNGPLIINISRLSKCKSKCKTHSKDWIFEDGKYQFIPGMNLYKDKYSLKYVVYTEENISQIEMANIRLLLNCMKTVSPVDDNFKEKVFAALDKHAWARLSELCDQLNIKDQSKIIRMIIDKHIFNSMDKELLVNPKSAWIASDPLYIQEALRQYPISKPERITVDTMDAPNKKQVEQAMEMVEGIQNGDKEKERSARRFREYVNNGGKKTMFEYFTPNNPGKGNRCSKRPLFVLEHLKEYIKKKYETAGFKTVLSSYIKYKNDAKNYLPDDCKPVTKKTFKKYVNLRDQEEQQRKIGGDRPSKQARDFTDFELMNIRGTYPFEYASFDARLMKCYVIVAEGNGIKYVLRPWMVSLIDEYASYVLAIWLFLHAPSRRSLSMLYRMCAREHGKIPINVNSDGGKENLAVFHLQLAANLNISLTWSPASCPRYNSSAEHFNKELKNKYDCYQPSFIKNIKTSRSMSRGHRPSDLAVLYIEDVVEELMTFKDGYNNIIVGNEMFPPTLRFTEGLERFPFAGKDVEINNEFLIKTAVERSRIEYSISERGSIFLDSMHFTHPELRKIRPFKSKLELRDDPEDPYKKYFCYGGKWQTVFNNKEKIFCTKSINERHAEALRVMDGRSARDQAKEDGQQLIIQKMQELQDKRDVERQQEEISETNIEADNKNYDDDILNMDVPELEESSWT